LTVWDFQCIGIILEKNIHFSGPAVPAISNALNRIQGSLSALYDPFGCFLAPHSAAEQTYRHDRSDSL
jgi:hypothetical protein